jgi:GAF domain-containing protein
MSEILRLISNSPSNVTIVLQAVAEQAAHICQARNVNIRLVENDNLRDVARIGELRRTLAFPLDRSSVAGRSVCDMRPVSVDDLQNANDEFARGREIARRDGIRSIAAVPLIQEGRALGTIVVYRTEIRPFEQKHIALLTNFAAQAVIAIENGRLLSELRESLEQQTATADVLRIISSSPGELQPVFQAMLENATRICEAKFGNLWLREGNKFRIVETHGAPRKYREYLESEPLVDPEPESAMARIARTGSVVQINDITAAPTYGSRMRTATIELAKARTLVGVPMLKENEVVGIIAIYRQEVRPFSDEQIAMLRSFAAQAVIAIENARLLGELRQRTADLSESLEQQTATSEVLGVISSSRGELQPVFQVMLENAVRICEANFGGLFLCEGEGVRSVAQQGSGSKHLELWQHQSFLDLRSSHPGLPLSRTAATKQIVQVADVAAEEGYRDRDTRFVALVESAGARTVLGVPMLKEDELVGAIIVYRTEVRPFSDKQIALLQNFAAQAVIAIENARLLNELRQRTEEVSKLNQQLEQRVADQVGEIERMSRLRRFLPPQVADLIVASGTEKQLESHRREITALFCDLRGFTGFSESSDPEDVMALLRAYHAAIGEIIIKYSGTLERYAGDGVMVIFNDPVPVENPALQAVLMALEMRAAIGGLIDKWRDLGHDLGFGIGIAHGFATLGTIGFEGRRDYAAIGTVSNVASRLCDEAKPGQILISPRVRQSVDKAVSVESVGEFALKGLRRPMLAYNVVSGAAVNELR